MSETFVLITGAWHGGWAWRPVAEHLRSAGHRVFTPTLPGLHDGDDPTAYQLSDVADAIVALVEEQDLNDVTLVAHSWGGYPMTAAAPRLAGRLRKVVYWSAFVPAAGRTLYDEVPPAYQELFDGLSGASGNNSVAMPLEVWQSAFMNDASEDVQRTVHALMVPHPMQYFTTTVEPLDAAALGVPVSYVLSVGDIALPPGEYGWDRFAERLGVTPIEAPGSHEACFTEPAGLAAALLEA
ncbi:alpha/beta fold hydrolase [Pseudonocardia sp. N23]|uniref:alpha/beta fold hydrolase n=1 Tax=Pseudonocardia sp. N23 TaxID=1987376 RepID=UPI000BFB9A84|nr:alpha/beta fold hydrolase [Pseudonocardia sp. N23]GAY07138.1 salicylate esterase [Pseudonocardia sp. N23]